MNNINKDCWPGWETTRLIGCGSFGAVYEIHRDVFGEDEKAALKVISIPQSDSDIREMVADGYDEESITSTFKGHLKNIVTEYSLMRKMNGSANVVNCDDFRYVQHDDGYGWDIYIKMELLTPLAEVLPAVITEEFVIGIAKDMCAALELCQKHNIIHRDIKPQNIFVSENGDYKLGDFGIAKTVEKTMGGTKTGTYKYMAPEVYSNKPYNATADIYSLGLVLYWLLNERRMPFMPLPPEKLKTGMDEESRNRRMSGEKIPAPKNGSDELKRIVLKACAFDPKNRYQSARKMREALARLSGDYVHNGSTQNPEWNQNDDPDNQSEDDIIEEIPSDDPESKTVGLVFKSTDEYDPSDHTEVDVIEDILSDDSDGKTVGPKFNTKSREGKSKEEKTKTKPWFIISVVCVIIALIAMVVPREKNGWTGPTEEIVANPTETHSHSWVDATCTTPKTCYTCGEVSGFALGHQWVDATYDAPKTCSVCGVEEGEKLLYEAVFLNELTPIGKYGKLWTSSERQLDSFAHTDVSDGKAYEDMDTPGHTAGPVYDYRGNRYTYGLTVDGSELASYYVSYNIEGKYTTFSGTCSMSEDMDDNWRASSAQDGKYFDIYGDGQWLFRTNTMKQGETPHSFCIDVTGVEVLTIQYPKTSFPSRIATLFDGKLSNDEGKDESLTAVANEKPVLSAGVITAGNYHSVYLYPDGTVYAAGSKNLSKYDNKGTRLDVSSWTDIVAISASSHTVGLKADGTVVACGVNRYGQCDLSSWTDIIAICAGDEHTVGLRSDGTVVAKGNNKDGQCDVSHWSNIVAIAACNGTTFGLRSDGTIITAGQKNYGHSWKNIATICSGTYDLVGLRNDGTVVAIGSCSNWDNNNIEEWRDIVGISASSSHIVGLRANGRVVACGMKKASEACAVDEWTDIIQVSAGMYFTIGLKSDGTVIAVGDNSNGQCNLG